MYTIVVLHAKEQSSSFFCWLVSFPSWHLLSSTVKTYQDGTSKTHKKIQTHTHTKKNWNRIDYSALAILCSLFLAGFFFVRIWSEKSLVLQHVDCIYLPKKVFHFMQDYLWNYLGCQWSPTQEFQTRKHLVI